MLLTAFLAVPVVHAADLDLTVSFTDADSVRVVLSDVLEAPQPRILAADDQGVQHIFDVAVQPADDGAYAVEFEITALEPTRRGRLRPRLVSTPRLQVEPGEPATLTQGARIPYVVDDEVRFRDRLMQVRAVVVE